MLEKLVRFTSRSREFKKKCLKTKLSALFRENKKPTSVTYKMTAGSQYLISKLMILLDGLQWKWNTCICILRHRDQVKRAIRDLPGVAPLWASEVIWVRSKEVQLQPLSGKRSFFTCQRRRLQGHFHSCTSSHSKRYELFCQRTWPKDVDQRKANQRNVRQQGEFSLLRVLSWSVFIRQENIETILSHGISVIWEVGNELNA